MAKNGTTYPVLKKFKDYDGNYGIVLIFFKWFLLIIFKFVLF
jgi:hypothetical protein